VGVRQNVAYVPGDVNLWPELSGGEIIDLLTGLRGGPDEMLRRELTEEFDLDPRRRARTYSKGNRQKVALIAAFVRPARLYLLDEPSAGLDPVMDAVFRRQVQRVSAEGATVLLSSHILSEVEHLCERVTIIRAGTVVESGTLSELRHLRRTRFLVSGASPADILQGLPGVHDLHTVPNGIEFEADQTHLPDVLARLSRAGLSGLTANPPSLEELFLRHYTHGSDGAAPEDRST
jgi:ABC-2 type transport system ATP-binding protein